jgi:hypothetical protein
MADGRDNIGRFTPGNKGGPGRPRTCAEKRRKAREQREEYMRHMHNIMPDVLKLLHEKVKAGDVAAAKLLLDRALPIYRIAEQEVLDSLAEVAEKLRDEGIADIDVSEFVSDQEGTPETDEPCDT